METRIKLVDTTLRDGEQAPGVSFSREDKLRIAAGLAELGIDEVEAGIPAMGAEVVRDIRSIVARGYAFKTISWCRAVRRDIEAAIATRSEAIHISFPVSDLHLYTTGKSRKWVLDTLPCLVAFARQSADEVYVGAEDATRAEPTFLKEFVSVAIASGVKRVRLADTLGCMIPSNVQQLFSELTTTFPEMDFECHAHNDLGMATANTLSAFEAGAQSASVTINGLGERAGNAPLEEVIMALRFGMNHAHSYNTNILSGLSSLVATASGHAVAVNKPVVGVNVYKHESGIHVKSQLQNSRSYQLYDEELIGRNSDNIVYGKHSGRAAIVDLMVSRGWYIDAQQVKQVLEWVKQASMAMKSYLTADEVERLYFTKGCLSEFKPRCR